MKMDHSASELMTSLLKELIEPLEGGKAGLVVGNARARFDDFQITGENIPNGGPGKPRPVAPQAKLATTWGRLKMK